MSSQQLHTQVLGDYSLVKELGEGLLGKVFLAQHRYLKKFFALKIFSEELCQNRNFIHHFENEVAILAALDHPHIVKIHNVSSFEGRYFLVSDALVDAQLETMNLTTYLQRKKRLEEQEVYLIAKQIALALDYAHQKSIVDEPLAHCGLKWNNILIDPLKEQIEVKIADFGLCKMAGMGALLSKSYRTIWEIMWEEFVETEGDIESLHTSFYQHYLFLAPEQKGKKYTDREADAKADIYSFGILLYFLLMNKFPEGIFPMPSSENKELKHHWDPLLTQCLHLDPDKRPLLLTPLIQQLLDPKEEGLKPILNPQEIVRPEYEPNPAAVFQVDKTIAIYVPKKAEVKEIDPLMTEMIIIAGGTFARGSNHGARDEMPRHAIQLSSYAIDIHPATNEQYVRFLTMMGGEKDANNNDLIRLRDSRIKKNGGKLLIESGYTKHPVVGVTWYGALAYAKWIGKRLPTEAEWEIAGTGGLEGAQYPTGDEIERSQANFFSSDTTAVMSYPPNSLGLFDMAGDVYEWCMDWYGYHYYETSMQEPCNPMGPAQGVYRVLRGGCWKSLKEDMRISHRHRNNPGSMNKTYGFRCAADVK